MKYICLPVLFLLLIASCSRGGKSASLFLYNMKDPYVRTFGNQIKSESSQIFEMQIFDSQNSQIIQNEFIENQIDSAHIMLINPVDRLGAYSIIKKLKSVNMPVIFFNREPLFEDLEIWDQAYYVGARAEQSGQIQAEMLMELFGDDGENLNKYDRNGNDIIETVILKGEQGHQDAETRTSEVLRTFTENHFRLDILITEVANWNRDEAFEKMKQILDRYSEDIELVISNNDAMALGAISLMTQEGFFRDSNENGRIDKDDSSWLPVVGIDGLIEAVNSINEGFLYGTVINDSRLQAKAIAELADFLCSGKDLKGMNYPLDRGKYIWIDYKVFQ
ncbi:MAG: galactose ABC transporter substrate-binding protein [Spirochaetaceae bacterium]|nr:galactose ABC transporter substrate-binding protein [Spirochaetaceae bacterium]